MFMSQFCHIVGEMTGEYSSSFLLAIEIKEELYLFFFRAKSGTTKNSENGSSDISFESPFSRDLNDIKNLSQFREKPVRSVCLLV